MPCAGDEETCAMEILLVAVLAAVVTAAVVLLALRERGVTGVAAHGRH